MKTLIPMTPMTPLMRVAARCASVALAACTLPAAAMPGGHSHPAHSGSSAAHPSPSPAAHPPAPAPAPSHVPKVEPLSASRVHEAGERLRSSPMPDVRPGYYGNPNAAATLRVPSQPTPPAFAKLQLATPAHPDRVREVGGNGSPRVAFNRRSIGGGSGVDALKRDDAYRLADNRAPRHLRLLPGLAPGAPWRRLGPYGNKGPVVLPNSVGGLPAQYVKHQPLKEPSPTQTLRIVVAKHPQDMKAAVAAATAAAQKPGVSGGNPLKNLATGPGYLSRHYGDHLDALPKREAFEPVHRVQ